MLCSTDSLILLSLVRLTSGFWLEFALVSGILLLVEDGCLLGGVTLGMCGISCDAQFCDHLFPNEVLEPVLRRLHAPRRLYGLVQLVRRTASPTLWLGGCFLTLLGGARMVSGGDSATRGRPAATRA